jgi:hypothetical protein
MDLKNNLAPMIAILFVIVAPIMTHASAQDSDSSTTGPVNLTYYFFIVLVNE